MKKIFDIFRLADKEIFLVGGYVRDSLLGKKSNDFDFATNALPEETIAILSTNGLKAIPTGIEFGTVQTIIDDEKVEITTYRIQESYQKGSRKPYVVFGSKLEDDLVRRDFSINSIAMKEDGTLIDPFNGEQDLRDGYIRTPGDAFKAFSDDPLRMLRACRFVARGFGEIDHETYLAMVKSSELASDLSVERVFDETTKLLLSPDPAAGLRLMSISGLIYVLFPELQVLFDFTEFPGDEHHLSVWEHTLATVEYTDARPELRWAALFHDVAKPVCWAMIKDRTTFRDHSITGHEIWKTVARKLKTSNSFRRTVSTLIVEHQSLPNTSIKTKGLRRLIHRVGVNMPDLLSLVEADIRAHHPRIVECSLAALAQTKGRMDHELEVGPEVTNKLPKGTGDVVMKSLGLRPGPELGVIIRRLQKMMIEGTVTVESDFAKVAKGLV